MAKYSIAALQALPETESSQFHVEFGLARCTATCRESCGYTCGQLSCTHTAGIVANASPLDAAILNAQATVIGQQGFAQPQQPQNSPSPAFSNQ